MPEKSNADSLQEAVRQHELASRHTRINLIEACNVAEERIEQARRLIRHIAMQRTFDRFQQSDEAALFDRLWPLAHPDDDEVRPPLFGNGASNTNQSSDVIS